MLTIYLAFVQNETKIREKVVLSKADISPDGKSAKFAIALPHEIIDGRFNLYGVYGGEGISASDPTLALLPKDPGSAESLASVQQRNDAMLTFSAMDISTINPEVSISFKHLGSLFSIILKNTGDTSLSDIAEVRLISESDEGWAYNTSEGGNQYNLVAEEFIGTESAGNFISFKASETTIKPGDSICFWGWYPPLPDVIWPELKLELRGTDGHIIQVTSNSHPPRTTATLSGECFYFFASWNENKLQFTNHAFEETPIFENITLLEYIQQGSDPLSISLSLYSDIINYAGLNSEISDENYTRIVPTNEAIRQLLEELGVISIEEIPKNVLKELFAYLVIDEQRLFKDISIGQTIGFPTRTGDNIYLTRELNKLYINKTDIFAREPIKVIGHDYSFKDGITHFVNIFPLYYPIIDSPEAAPETIDLDYSKLQTIEAVADNYVNKMTPNVVTERSNNWQNQVQFTNRHAFLKFELPADLNLNDFTAVHIELTSYDVRGTEHIIGLYEVNDNNWDESSITYNNMVPAMRDEIINFGPLEKKTYSLNITKPINEYYSKGNLTISLALQMISGTPNASGFNFVCFHDREAKNDASRNGPGPTIIFGNYKSELLLDQNKALNLSAGTSAKISKSNISMTSPTGAKYEYSDNNIMYVLSSTPSYGTVTLYGKPLKIGDRFTQAELETGLIKYIHEGSDSSGDSFNLNVRDYVGGVYPNSVTVNITIR